MKNSFLDNQILEAQNNLNYFFEIIIIKICKFIFKLSICLIINGLISFLFINIICLLYSIYSMYNIYREVNYYTNIIKDIKSTLKLKILYFTIDPSFLKRILLKKEVNYGK